MEQNDTKQQPSAIAKFLGSLKSRLIVSTLVVQGILVPLLFGSVIYLVQKGYKEQFITEVRSESYLYARLIASHFPYNMEQVDVIMQEALIGGHMVYSELVSPDTGQQIAMAVAPGVEPVFKEDLYFGQHRDGIFFISEPVVDTDGTRLATLHLGYSEQATHEQIVLAFRWGGALVVLFLGISVLMADLTATKITRPLHKLREQTKNIISGNFEEKLNVITHITEVSSLAVDLDQMRRELVQQTSTLEFHAMHDTLTGLPNRALLRDRVNFAIGKASREGASFPLLLMDLDHFKEVNDTLGHQFGDIVLQLVAAKLNRTLRDCDTVARLGGDEFAILLQVGTLEHAKKVAEKIRKALEKPFLIDECTLHVGSSIGIAMYPEDGEDFQTLLRRADVAMYTAKRAGTGIAGYEKSRDDHSPDLLSLTGELRECIDRDELVLNYQPKISLKEDKMIGVEALVRWEHPKRGNISPSEFIPLAEKSGLIEPLTLWLLESAVQQIQRWHSNGMKISIAINVSAKNLQNPDFSSHVEKILEKYPIERGYLIMELTESAILSDPIRAKDILNQFNALGIRMAIDDFGTGYSSLAYLKRLPVSELKVDKMFVRDMTRSHNDLAIVKATIDMAHHLDLVVVAEGIADAYSLELLKELGCDVGQGYYFSPPVPLEELEANWKNDWKTHTIRGSLI